MWHGGWMAPGDTSVSGLPFADGQEILTDRADAVCTRVDCPHTTAALAAARDTGQVTVGRAQLDELLARVAALEEGT